MLREMRRPALAWIAGLWLLSAGLFALPCSAVVDADCDGETSEADLGVAAVAIFEGVESHCGGADANGDRRLSAADIVAAARALAYGPVLTFVGVATSAGKRAPVLGMLEDGTPVYFRPAGFGFNLVIEARGGPAGTPVGTELFALEPDDPTVRPDLQIVVDRPLGNGSPVVCDEEGVPAAAPFSFEFRREITERINDLTCRFLAATAPFASCTFDDLGRPSFLGQDSRVQFCLPVARSFGFPDGDTRLRVQVRDEAGRLSRAAALVIRVGQGPPPPTFTPRPATPTRTPIPTRTRTFTRTPTPTASPTVTRTSTPPRPTFTATRTRTPTGTPRTSTPGASPSVPVASRTPTFSPRAPSPTRTPTPSRTPAGSPSRTPSPTGTPSPTRTPTQTMTPTPSAPQGPRVVFFGLARADDTLVEPVGTSPEGYPIYQRPFGAGFSLVVEAAPGPSGRPVAMSTFEVFGCPDFQIQVNRPLGDGSIAVCDSLPPNDGGVPAIDPPRFDDPALCDPINDLACRFLDGGGEPRARSCTPTEACVRDQAGDFMCVASEATVQFCGFIAATNSFPPGDTLVSARVRDTTGAFGPVSRIVVRIAPQ